MSKIEIYSSEKIAGIRSVAIWLSEYSSDKEGRILVSPELATTEGLNKRNVFLKRGLKKFKDIEKLDISDKQSKKISNIRTTYSKELLMNLRPFSIENDIKTFLNLIELNKNYKELFKDNPHLEKNLNDFKSSLKRSHEFRHLISQL